MRRPHASPAYVCQYDRDYWHLPDQYTLHRTQAAAYFPEELHDALVDALLDYGEKQLVRGGGALQPVHAGACMRPAGPHC